MTHDPEGISHPPWQDVGTVTVTVCPGGDGRMVLAGLGLLAVIGLRRRSSPSRTAAE